MTATFCFSVTASENFVAGWDTLWVRFLWALLMLMATLTSQAVRRLPAVHSDVARMLKIVAFCKTILRSLSFDLNNYVTECCQFEDL